MIDWGPIEIADGETVTRRWSTIEWRLRREQDEWRLTFRRIDVDPEEERAGESSEQEAEWVRYIGRVEDSLSVLPALPDRPVLVRPDSPIILLPGRQGRFYFSVPVWLRFLASREGKDQVVHEEPTDMLSNTWFGDPSAGELCYALDDPLLRSYETMETSQLEAVCPLIVKNGSAEPLNFERICVHAEFLNLYRGDRALWTNEVTVQFKGADHASQVSMSPKTPSGTTLITGRRLAANRSFIRKSFNLLRQVTGM